MNFLTSIAFQFYRHFHNRKTGIPYLSTLITVTLFLYMHFLLLVVIFDQLHLVSFTASDSKEEKWIKLLLALFPFYLFSCYFIRRRQLEHQLTQVVDESRSQRVNTRLIVYSLLLVFLFCITAII